LAAGADAICEYGYRHAIGMDGLIGIVAAAVIGWLVYSAHSGEVDRIKKIQEIGK
jgi:hypothetical protein